MTEAPPRVRRGPARSRAPRRVAIFAASPRFTATDVLEVLARRIRDASSSNRRHAEAGGDFAPTSLRARTRFHRISSTGNEPRTDDRFGVAESRCHPIVAPVWRACRQDVGAEVAARFGVPVIMYEERPRIRRARTSRTSVGEFEGLAAKMADPAWGPTSGRPRRPLGQALLSSGRACPHRYNINLNTDRLDVARDRAAIRHSSRRVPVRQAADFKSGRPRIARCR